MIKKEKKLTFILLATKQDMEGKTLKEISEFKNIKIIPFSILEKELFTEFNGRGFIREVAGNAIIQLRNALYPKVIKKQFKQFKKEYEAENKKN